MHFHNCVGNIEVFSLGECNLISAQATVIEVSILDLNKMSSEVGDQVLGSTEWFVRAYVVFNAVVHLGLTTHGVWLHVAIACIRLSRKINLICGLIVKGAFETWLEESLPVSLFNTCIFIFAAEAFLSTSTSCFNVAEEETLVDAVNATCL
jgi:hypothetical protein